MLVQIVSFFPPKQRRGLFYFTNLRERYFGWIEMSTNCLETNVTFPVYLLDKEPFGVTILRIGFQIALGFLGVIGNVTVCVVIIQKPKVLGPASQYLFSLAIADLCTLIFNLPIAILKEEDPFRWSLGRAFCLYIMPTTETFFGAAIFSIGLIGFERYVNIARKTARARRRLSYKKRCFILIGVWASAFAVGSIPMYAFIEYDSCHKMCHLPWSMTVFITYIMTLTVLWYVFPLAVVAFSYIKIAQLVSKRTTSLQGMPYGSTSMGNLHSSSIKTMLRQKRKTYRILTPLVILFAVCMLPLTLLRLVAIFWTEIAFKPYYTVLLTLMVVSTILNSAADPVIYCVVNREFRQQVKSIFGVTRLFQKLGRFISIRSLSLKGKGSFTVSVESQTSQTTRL